MLYEDGHYLFPPRPEKAISPHFLTYYQTEKWWAQVKLNGTCNVIFVSPDRKVSAMTRHNDQHKNWSVSEHTSEIFKNLPGKGWYVFTAELMHSKIPGIRDINYIHDVLVSDNDLLIGSKFSSRQDLLTVFFAKYIKGETVSHYILDDHTWLAKNYTKDFFKLFKSLDKPEFEGLVLKNPNGELASCEKPTLNSGWQVKSRRTTKIYGF